MKAIDTNVVIRLLVGDDPVQQARALDLLTEPLLVTVTVLIESAWVLRSRYGFDRDTVVSLLEALFDYPTMHVQSDARVRWALHRYRTIGDIADLLHVATCAPADTFATFDRGIAAAVGGDAPAIVETLA